MSEFQASAIPFEPFARLFELDDSDLESAGARRFFADAKPGYPCRVSLQDAEIDEEVILARFEHLARPSPYAASGPVFVRRAAVRASPKPGEIPAFLQGRLLSIRSYDYAGLMTETDVQPCAELESSLRRLMGRDEIAFIHVHFARPGCFACRFDRA